MTQYKHAHLLNWLNNHTCINLAEVERQSDMPKDALRHFTKSRRDIAEIHFMKVEKLLVDYGYRPLSSE